MKMKKLRTYGSFELYLMLAEWQTVAQMIRRVWCRDDIIGTWKVTANDWTNSEGESGRNDPEHMGQTLSVSGGGFVSVEIVQLDTEQRVLTLYRTIVAATYG